MEAKTIYTPELPEGMVFKLRGGDVVFIGEKNRSKDTFIQKNQTEWKDLGQKYKAIREDRGHSLSFVAYELGISASRLKRFEEGEPVTSSKLIQAAYSHFLNFWELRSDMNKVLRGYENK
ncbi:helix-turn-helix domain-containing protein [Halobacillus karajensis]|uniref:HTH cro/C1-type domain-containing protein n=1 Tax=Halobacillus karajensis TaxID=195088 RepID=A0A024P732_9BACI|nr:transcriptional regulator [Halobacillus karajensis]CDQ20992.1 hypothetical protein BN982_03353 [Halobacillus karajensis]CDQ24944.1 hypothetical protein BN983_03245 [Halobacillus karajensis]CDQ28695.1 hypothetical protein BN981_03008 [Halobacillus karajensis]